MIKIQRSIIGCLFQAIRSLRVPSYSISPWGFSWKATACFKSTFNVVDTTQPQHNILSCHLKQAWLCISSCWFAVFVVCSAIKHKADEMAMSLNPGTRMVPSNRWLHQVTSDFDSPK